MKRNMLIMAACAAVACSLALLAFDVAEKGRPYVKRIALTITSNDPKSVEAFDGVCQKTCYETDTLGMYSLINVCGNDETRSVDQWQMFYGKDKIIKCCYFDELDGYTQYTTFFIVKDGRIAYDSTPVLRPVMKEDTTGVLVQTGEFFYDAIVSNHITYDAEGYIQKIDNYEFCWEDGDLIAIKENGYEIVQFDYSFPGWNVLPTRFVALPLPIKNVYGDIGFGSCAKMNWWSNGLLGKAPKHLPVGIYYGCEKRVISYTETDGLLTEMGIRNYQVGYTDTIRYKIEWVNSD